MTRRTNAWLMLGALMVSACGSDRHSDSVGDGDGDSGVDASTPALPSGATEARSMTVREHPNVDASVVAELGKDNRAFAVSLYRQLSAGAGNVFLSPYSVSVALAMTCAGARGETATQIKNALHFELEEKTLNSAFNEVDLTLDARGQGATGRQGKPFQLSVANSLWVQNGYELLPSYLDALASDFGAGVFLLDFARSAEPSRLAINGWVEQQTHDRIKDFLPEGSVNGGTRVVLTNAAYFNGGWRSPFDARDTTNEAFHATSGDVSVPMMHNGMSGAYAEGDGYQAAILPYSAPELGLLIILPAAGKFAAFDASFDAAKLELILASFQDGQQLAVELPRFDASTKKDLIPALKKLGMIDAFTGGADFSGMTSMDSPTIGAILHEANITVDETGTEAAAATAVSFDGGAAPSQVEPKELHVDRPFLYGIIDRPTGELLFVGRMLNPKG